MRNFHIFNSLTKQMELFKPKVPGKVGMYVCGISPYDFSHLGHARVYVTFDVLYRYLKHLGYEVTYVRNFTDVDYKIIRKAYELREDPLNLSRRFSKEFNDDMVDLECLPPTHELHMSQMKDMIAQIIHNGCGYVVDGDVYLSVDKFSGNGHLCGNKLEDIQAGEGVVIDPRKRHPFDFALWKSAKPGESSWNSPWGPGRPDWNIQSSEMSMHDLNPSFDIHGGARDLIFPHHETETAQSCAACSVNNARYWIHTDLFLNGNGSIENGSMELCKSIGDFITIREVLRLYHPLALRFFLIDRHYRSPVCYTSKELENVSDQVFNIYEALYNCEMTLSPFREKSFKDEITPSIQDCIDRFRNCFQNLMEFDLHAYCVLSAIGTAMKTINIVLNSLKNNQQQPSLIRSLIALEKEVKDVLNILGLMSSSTYSEVLKQLMDKALKRTGLTEDQVLQLIQQRNSVRNKMKENFHARRRVARGSLIRRGKLTPWEIPVDKP